MSILLHSLRCDLACVLSGGSQPLLIVVCSHDEQVPERDLHSTLSEHAHRTVVLSCSGHARSTSSIDSMSSVRSLDSVDDDWSWGGNSSACGASTGTATGSSLGHLGQCLGASLRRDFEAGTKYYDPAGNTISRGRVDEFSWQE